MINKVNIITDGYGTGDGGDTVLDQINQFYSDKEYEVRYISTRGGRTGLFKANCVFLNFRVFRETALYRVFSRIPFFYSMNILYAYNRKKRVILHECACKESLNFVILRGDTFFVADWLNKMNAHYFLYIPDGLCGENDDFLLEAYKRVIYRRLCENAKLIFLTNPLAIFELEKFEIENFYFLNPYHEFRMLSDKVHDSEKLRIVFAGSIYARDAFYVFFNALSKFVDTTKVKVDFSIYTSGKLFFPLTKLNSNLRIELKPLVSLSYLKDEIRRFDLCYLPYSFRYRDKKRMIFGFPSKASLYFSSLVPVFVHAPLYSSISDFCIKNGHSLVSNSLDDVEVLSKLLKWWYDDDKQNPTDISEKFSKSKFYESLEKTIC